MPEEVERYVKQLKKKYDRDSAWAIAWTIYKRKRGKKGKLKKPIKARGP